MVSQTGKRPASEEEEDDEGCLLSLLLLLFYLFMFIFQSVEQKNDRRGAEALIHTGLFT